MIKSEILQPLRPPKLSEGDCLAIYSPSFPGPSLYAERTRRGVEALRQHGFRVLLAEAAMRQDGYTSGTDMERSNALMDLFSDPKVKGIVCSVGGFNSNDILPLLDYSFIAMHPKVIVGYSDATAILLAIYACSGLVTFHGPALLAEWGEFPVPLPYTVASFLEVTHATAKGCNYQMPEAWTNEWLSWGTGADSRPRTLVPNSGWASIRAGRATGRLVGGNLETINALVGSPYCPSFSDALLFVEATAEEAYLPRLDRALRHLDLAGLIQGIRGLIVARCPDAMPEKGVTLEIVVRRLGDRYQIPVAGELDFGHTDPKMTLPIGVRAELVCGTRSVELKLLEPAVRGAY